MKIYKIIFTNRELNDLFDMLYIIQSGDIMKNDLDKSWKSIMDKIEPIVCPEIKEWENKDGKHNNNKR